MPSNKLAKTFINKLRDAGIEPTYEQFVRFQDLGQAASKSTDSSIALMLGREIGGRKYYPLTLGASIWYSDRAVEWFSDDDNMLAVALLYAMHNSYNLDALRDLDTPNRARLKLRLWGIGVRMTPDEASELMRDTLGLDIESGEAAPSEDAGDYGIAVRVLQRFYGETREHWLNEPADHCEALIRDAVKANSDPDAPPDPNDPAIKAFYYANKLYHEIVEAYNG